MTPVEMSAETQRAHGCVILHRLVRRRAVIGVAEIPAEPATGFLNFSSDRHPGRPSANRVLPFV